MKMIEILLLVGFGLPIVSLCIFFVIAARRMAREEAQSEELHRAQTQARRRRARYIPASARTGVCR